MATITNQMIMDENKKKKKGKGLLKMLTGMVVGGAIGSILGLTLAPKKGTETRKAIKEKSMELFLKGKEQFEAEKEKEKKELGFLKKTIFKALKPKNKHGKFK